jgi:hypothetical protein
MKYHALSFTGILVLKTIVPYILCHGAIIVQIQIFDHERGLSRVKMNLPAGSKNIDEFLRLVHALLFRMALQHGQRVKGL